MKMTQYRINSERLRQSIEKLATFGKNENGGLDRTTFTEAELEARDWLKTSLKKANLQVRVDEAANIWAKKEGQLNDLPVITFGSHIDTVPNGGKYDGALGVLMALEVMQVLEENQIKTRHPFELVSFSAEEPNPFGLSTFGSRAITGKLKTKDIEQVIDSAGNVLTEALKGAGGNPTHFERSVRSPNELAAYLEVHIEQGKRLLNHQIPVGVVSAITGIYREEVTVFGEANHAGTTLMDDRKDALASSSEMVLALEKICSEYPENEVVGTVGKLMVLPNSANIIPAEVRFTLEVRGKTKEEMKDVIEKWENDVKQIQINRSVRIDRSVLLNQDPAPMDALLIKKTEEAAKHLGYESLLLGSMAGHDATHMASITRSGMIFVPSIDGRSHCPEEFSRMEDIEKVANVFLHTLLALDCELNSEIS
ncbi:Zn-dependent hydrolase [Alkalihalobacillus sp. MEB130]|uniref:Zn-dependent hydrolase n=1 Tax=Alkalihalobacillus sp. MEB130 TaxID=2976704 RepID=UPI0028DE7700|nr:Zn-dependent hydrolase [Alkalihalobacillus sp. MEB130]MDT8861365.1 Zn-dependent hydrolase [Alkalihalobacillus sp. MEB130]